MSSKSDVPQEPIALRPLSSLHKKRLQARGVPGQDFMSPGLGFDVDEFIVSMEPEIPGTNNRVISRRKQLRNLNRILRNPLGIGPYTLGIASYPSDSRAKWLAQEIMKRAMTQYLDSRQSFGVRAQPLWHRVFGSYRDPLRDDPTSRPAMLIIANVHDEASSIKMEKVRDLLELYSDIPRIVVSGGVASIDTFAFRLNYPLNFSAYIGPSNLIQENV